jgi:hypothetical protein
MNPYAYSASELYPSDVTLAHACVLITAEPLPTIVQLLYVAQIGTGCHPLLKSKTFVLDFGSGEPEIARRTVLLSDDP